MKLSPLKSAMVGFCIISLTACGSLTNLTGNNETDTPSGSDENNTEAAYASAVEALTTSMSAETSDGGSASADISSTQTLLAPPARFHCENTDAVTETYACDGATGTMTRSVAFADCTLDNGFRVATLNGSMTNSVVNGAAEMCADNNEIDFANMVLGNGSDAVHTHDIGDDGMVFSFTNDFGKTVTVTRTGSESRAFSAAVDEDADGHAETVTSTIDQDLHIVRSVDGTTVHDVNVFTTDDSFTAVDENGTESTVDITRPVNDLTFDADGFVSTRTITSGDLVVDHNLAEIRLVFSVGTDGLTFDANGPQSGRSIVTAYTINGDGTYTPINTGTLTFTDGVASGALGGKALSIRPVPTH